MMETLSYTLRGSQAACHYSTDGCSVSQTGGAFTLNRSWESFIGYRYRMFEFANGGLGWIG